MARVNVGNNPGGLQSALGKRYCGNSKNMSVIDTTKKTVPASMNVGKLPVSIGKIVIPFTSSTPVANFSSNVSNGYVPLAVKFTDLSKNATGWRWDFGDGLWRWDFGDGNNSTRKNTINTYPVAGNYTVNLTVSNANGTNSKTIKISVLKKEEISTS